MNINRTEEKYTLLEEIPKEPTKEDVDKIDDFGRRLENLEKRIKETTTFLLFVASAVIITFFFASIPILYDYYRDNYGRYEKYLKDVDELKIRLEMLEKRNDLILENQINK